MKRITGILFAAVALLFAAPAGAQGPETERAEEKLARLDESIAQRSLELNYCIWACYLDYVEQMRLTPAVMKYPGLDYRAVCDTVPEIRALGKRLRAASDAYTKILQSDPKYKAVHGEYIALKGVDDPKRRNVNKEQYNLMYERLRKKNKNYIPGLRAVPRGRAGAEYRLGAFAAGLLQGLRTHDADRSAFQILLGYDARLARPLSRYWSAGAGAGCAPPPARRGLRAVAAPNGSACRKRKRFRR